MTQTPYATPPMTATGNTAPMTPQSLVQAPTPQVDADRKRQMAEAWKAFRGAFQPPLKVEKGQPDDNVIVNHMEPIVTKGASFLFGPVLKIEATGEATDTSTQPMKPAKKKKSTPQQDYLDGAWGDDDERMTLLSEAAMNGGVCGQVFLKLIPPHGTMQYPRLVVLDPQIVRIVTAPDDCSVHLAYIIEYAAGLWQKKQVIARVDPRMDASLVGDSDLADSWTITNYLRNTALGDDSTKNPWIQIGASEDWQYPFPPIFTNKNLPNPNESWGIPDLTQDLINENKVLNFLFSNLARIIKYHGHPKTYASGIRSAQIDMTVDGVICLPQPEAKLEMLAAMENFSGILQVLSSIMSNIDEQSRVPAVALGRVTDMPKGNISGVALQLLFQPLIEKTIQKQRLYGSMIRQVSRAILIVGGFIDVSAYEDYEITLHFQNLLPVDDLAAAQTAQILKALGVSDATLMAQLGYDSDDEMDKSAEEDAKKMLAYSRGQGFPVAPPTMPNQQPQSGTQPGQTSENVAQPSGGVQ